MAKARDRYWKSFHPLARASSSDMRSWTRRVGSAAPATVLRRGADDSGDPRTPIASQRLGAASSARGRYRPAASGGIARSLTTPTTSSHGPGVLGWSGRRTLRIRRPTGFRPPSTSFTNDWFTIAAPESGPPSAAVNARPARIGAPRTSKKFGPTEADDTGCSTAEAED